MGVDGHKCHGNLRFKLLFLLFVLAVVHCGTLPLKTVDKNELFDWMKDSEVSFRTKDGRHFSLEDLVVALADNGQKIHLLS